MELGFASSELDEKLPAMHPVASVSMSCCHVTSCDDDPAWRDCLIDSSSFLICESVDMGPPRINLSQISRNAVISACEKGTSQSIHVNTEFPRSIWTILLHSTMKPRSLSPGTI